MYDGRFDVIWLLASLRKPPCRLPLRVVPDVDQVIKFPLNHEGSLLPHAPMSYQRFILHMAEQFREGHRNASEGNSLEWVVLISSCYLATTDSRCGQSIGDYCFYEKTCLHSIVKFIIPLGSMKGGRRDASARITICAVLKASRNSLDMP